MKVSAKTEYACIAILELACGYGAGGPVRSRQIAETHGVPHRFLVQILLQLKAAGLVSSTRGVTGGYRLTRPPEEVSLAQVMSAIEGPSSSTGRKSTNASPESPAVKVLMRAWQDVDARVREILSGITFAELVDRAKRRPR